MPESYFIGGAKGRAFRDHHLGTLHGQPPYRDDSRYVLASLEKMVEKPGPLDVDTLLDREIFTSKGAVEDLGLNPAAQADWARFLEKTVYSSEVEAIIRQQLFVKMKAEDWDQELRKVMFQRAMSLYKNTRKSVVSVDDLQKGDPAPGQNMSVVTPDELQKGHTDKMPGGVADKKKTGDFDTAQLKAGAKEEMEHTDDPSKAKEIAMDHLTSDPKYYIKLKTIEKAEPRGGTYHRRVPTTSKGGKKGFKYYYDPAKYNASPEAHQSGEDMADQAMGSGLVKTLKGAGDKGCCPEDLTPLAKKYGGKALSKMLHKKCGKGGDMSYKGGRFYGAKKEAKDG